MDSTMILRHSYQCRVCAIVTLCTILLAGLPQSIQAQNASAEADATKSAEAKLAAAAAAATAGRKKYPVTREDIVVAMPVDQAHLTVAHASRVWRKVTNPSATCTQCPVHHSYTKPD